MELEFKNPPRGRGNDLLPYGEIITALAQRPGQTARVAKDQSKADAASIVNTFKKQELPADTVLTVTTYKAESLRAIDEADKLRDVYAVLERVPEKA